MKSKALVGALLAALGFIAGGFEGLILAVMVAVLLAIPGRKVKRYAVRFVA